MKCNRWGSNLSKVTLITPLLTLYAFQYLHKLSVSLTIYSS